MNSNPNVKKITFLYVYLHIMLASQWVRIGSLRISPKSLYSAKGSPKCLAKTYGFSKSYILTKDPQSA